VIKRVDHNAFVIFITLEIANLEAKFGFFSDLDGVEEFG